MRISEFTKKAQELRPITRLRPDLKIEVAILSLARKLARPPRQVLIATANQQGACLLHEIHKADDLIQCFNSHGLKDFELVRQILNILINLFQNGTIDKDSIIYLKETYLDIEEKGTSTKEAVLNNISKYDPTSKTNKTFSAYTHPPYNRIHKPRHRTLASWVDEAERYEEQRNFAKAAYAFEEAAKIAARKNRIAFSSRFWQKAAGLRSAARQPREETYALEEAAKMATILHCFEKALSLWKKALIFRKREGQDRAIAFVYEEIAKTLEDLGPLKEAIEYWNLAIVKYEEDEAFLEAQFASQRLAEIEEKE